MTNYVATVYAIQVKQGSVWKPHHEDTTEYHFELSGRKALDRIRLKYPNETFRVEVRKTTYTRESWALEEAA